MNDSFNTIQNKVFNHKRVFISLVIAFIVIIVSLSVVITHNQDESGRQGNVGNNYNSVESTMQPSSSYNDIPLTTTPTLTTAPSNSPTTKTPTTKSPTKTPTSPTNSPTMGPHAFFKQTIGTFGSGINQFSYPSGITIDQNNMIYISDMNNHRIVKYNSSWYYQETIGSRNTLFSPHGLSHDLDGNLYVASQYNDRIDRFNSTGYINDTITPTIILVTSNVTDANGLNVTKTENVTLPTLFTMDYAMPQGVYISRNDKIYVVDTFHHDIKIFDINGTFVNQFGGYGRHTSYLHTPNSMIINSLNEIYVTDSNNHRIVVYDENGVYLRSYGRWGFGSSSPDKFDTPMGIAVDASDNIYVVDKNNHRIKKYTRNFEFLYQFGGEIQFDERYHPFNFPMGIAVSPVNNDIYVVDSQHHRIYILGQYLL